MGSLNSWNVKNRQNFFSRQYNQIRKVALVVGFNYNNFELFGLVTWYSWSLESLARVKPKVDDSRAHDNYLKNLKSENFLQQKAAINATFRIWFYCLEKKFRRFYRGSTWTVQDFILCMGSLWAWLFIKKNHKSSDVELMTFVHYGVCYQQTADRDRCRT